MVGNPPDSGNVLRQATPDDVDFIRDCAHRAYQIYVGRIGRPPAPMVANFAQLTRQGKSDIILAGQQRCGFVVSYPLDDHLFIENVAISPEYQGCGLASVVFRDLEDRALGLGLRGLALYTNEKMTENHGLYIHLGFLETDRRREAGFDRVFYRKPFIETP